MPGGLCSPPFSYSPLSGSAKIDHPVAGHEAVAPVLMLTAKGHASFARPSPLIGPDIADEELPRLFFGWSPVVAGNFFHCQHAIEEVHLPLLLVWVEKMDEKSIAQNSAKVNPYSKCTWRIRAATIFSNAGYFFIAGTTKRAASRAFFIISRSVNLARRKFIKPLWAVP